MRWFACLALFILSCAPKTHVTGKVEPKEPDLIALAYEQKSLIEETFKVIYQDTITISFGLPEGIDEKGVKLQDAWFTPDTEEILIDPVFRDALEEPGMDSVLCQSIRHELGHAYAFQTAKRLGFNRWPPLVQNPPEFLAEGFDSIIGYVMQNEGIAQIFEMLGKPYWNNCDFEHYNPDQNVYLPLDKDDIAWHYGEMTLDIFYDGGYCLCQPIIRANVEAGVKYIITHKFIFPDYNLRAAVKAYISDALYALPKAGQQ